MPEEVGTGEEDCAETAAARAERARSLNCIVMRWSEMCLSECCEDGRY
jgi:hypothetical protein